MNTEQTQEKEITIEGELKWDPDQVVDDVLDGIPVLEPLVQLRLGDYYGEGERVPDYCETESDPYYRERVISRVKG